MGQPDHWPTADTRGSEQLVGFGLDLVPGLFRFGGLEGELRCPLDNREGGAVPADPAVLSGLAVAPVIGDGVPLVCAGARVDNQHLTVVLPAARFELQRGLVQGGNFFRHVAALLTQFAKRLSGKLAGDVEGGHGSGYTVHSGGHLPSLALVGGRSTGGGVWFPY